MKTQKFKKITLIGLVFGLALLGASAYAQFQDSSAGTNALRGVPVIQQKYLPPPPTPVVNNITQVTQVVQPNTYPASGSGSGYNSATAYADCGSGKVLGGGGTCSNGQGLVAISISEQNGNGWSIACGAGFQNGRVDATASAVCSAN